MQAQSGTLIHANGANSVKDLFMECAKAIKEFQADQSESRKYVTTNHNSLNCLVSVYQSSRGPMGARFGNIYTIVLYVV